MIKQIRIPAFCLTHKVQYDRVGKFGCVECYADKRISEIHDERRNDILGMSTLDAKQELKETFDARLDEAINQIMKHIDDCVDGIGDKEELAAGIEEELKEFFDDCVRWS